MGSERLVSLFFHTCLLPCLAMRHSWSTELGVPLVSPPSTVPMARRRLTARFSDTLGERRDTHESERTLHEDQRVSSAETCAIHYKTLLKIFQLNFTLNEFPSKCFTP